MLDTFLLLVISQLFITGMVFWIFAECYKAFSCAFVESNSTEGQNCSRLLLADFVIGAIQLVIFLCATTYLVLQRRRFIQRKSAPFKELATTTSSVGFYVLSNDPFGYSYRCRPHVDQPAEADSCYKTMLARDVNSANLELIFRGCGLNAERGREWAQNEEASSIAHVLHKWHLASKAKKERPCRLFSFSSRAWGSNETRNGHAIKATALFAARGCAGATVGKTLHRIGQSAVDTCSSR
eukprot:INCI16260.16.p2 GENE.INCI16260.16~~INCI16260.16.p2  ORF type:complete len:239 (+),score=34.49 INCI16260.16:1563-2279(+)